MRRADALARERGVVLHPHEACERDAMAGSRDLTEKNARHSTRRQATPGR